MTKKEAFLILGIDDIDDVEYAFEDLVFEFNSFFISKVPFTKLFNSKLKKLKQIFDAKELLLPEKRDNNIVAESQIEKCTIMNNVHEAYHLFCEKEMKIKLSISNSKSYEDYVNSVNALLENYKINALNWREGVQEFPEKNGIKMSVEPDVMMIFEEIKKFNSLGFVNFNEINALSSDNLLKQEAIRLYLWTKFEENV